MSNAVRRTRAGLAAVFVWTGLLVLLTGCTGGEPSAGGKPRSAADHIRITPADGTKDVAPDGGVEVSVPSGRLERVRVTRIEDAEPAEIPGGISGDGLRWRPDDRARLQLAAKYRVDAVALDGHGRRSARHSTFTTLVPEHRLIAYSKPENRSTVGTGMIVSITFNREVTNHAAVQRAIRITADPPVEVVGHWFSNGRIDFRPRTYWKPGTKVKVGLGLRDVQGAPGVYGIQDKTFAFTVGRSQISTVDAERHIMEVRRDGDLIATLPVTAGARKTTTYNGTMVVSEMFDVTRMNGATVGFRNRKTGKSEYDIKDVPHAIRLTTSGTFLHGNYWSRADTFGRANVSHGCIGLRDEQGGSELSPAGWFFDRTLIGDIVKVVNSRDRTVAPDNGLNGWNMDWAKWKAGSALG